MVAFTRHPEDFPIEHRHLEVGLEEHLQLEYKSALYEDNDRGNREFLQDICMFANSSGGILLLGVSERRDEILTRKFLV